MTTPRTVEQCKSMLFRLGIKYGVAPRLISERLLSSEDKDAMLQGQISVETLDCFVKAWKEDGLPDYVNRQGSL